MTDRTLGRLVKHIRLTSSKNRMRISSPCVYLVLVRMMSDAASYFDKNDLNPTCVELRRSIHRDGCLFVYVKKHFQNVIAISSEIEIASIFLKNISLRLKELKYQTCGK